MSTTTENLGLFKYDPSTDGANTFNIKQALNENWDKLDAAVSAARSAGEYDADKSYTAGDYCLRDGTLYRCTTATEGEAWNAAHWAATTLAAELQTLYAALAGKAATLTLTCTVPLSWTASGSYFYQQVSVPGMLETDNPVADILPGSDNAANKMYAEAWAKVQSIDTLDGAVKLWCTSKPGTVFPVQFKVVR